MLANESFLDKKSTWYFGNNRCKNLKLSPPKWDAPFFLTTNYEYAQEYSDYGVYTIKLKNEIGSRILDFNSSLDVKKLHWPKILVDKIRDGKNDLNSIGYDMYILANQTGNELMYIQDNAEWRAAAQYFMERSIGILKLAKSNSMWGSEKDHQILLQMWKDIHDAGFDGFMHIEFGSKILAIFNFHCIDKISIEPISRPLDEEESISNNELYLSNMAKSFADKAWFLKHIPKDVTTIVDFGGGTGDFAKFCQGKRPDLTYVVIDNNTDFFDQAKSNGFITASSLQNLVANKSIDFNRALLVLSSVIHEIYSYADANEFWKDIKKCGFRAIAIRDMSYDETAMRNAPIDAICWVYENVLMSDKVKYKGIPFREITESFEDAWGKICDPESKKIDGKNLFHFLIKYRYQENWSREVEENYLPISKERLASILASIGYSFKHKESSKLEFYGKCWKKDFKLDIPDNNGYRKQFYAWLLTLDTHIKWFLEKTYGSKESLNEDIQNSNLNAAINDVLSAYKQKFGFDLSYMKFKVDNQPVYTNGEPCYEYDEDECAGDWTSLGWIRLNPDMKSVMDRYGVAWHGSDDIDEFTKIIIAHELAHEVWNNIADDEFKQCMLDEAKKQSFETTYLKTVKPSKLDEETFCEYLASKVTKQDCTQYDPPYTLGQIKAHYPENIYVKLANDPVHRWRAETGIELIHKEPTEEELDRIWKNWQLMPQEMKEISDKKSIELFGCTNAEHYNKLKASKDHLNENKSTYLQKYRCLAQKVVKCQENIEKTYMNDDLHEQINSWIKTFKNIDEDKHTLKDDKKLSHCPYLYVTCKNTSLNPSCRKVGMSYGEKIDVKLKRYSTPVSQDWQLYAIVFIDPNVAFDEEDEEDFINDISANGKMQLTSKELIKSDDGTVNKGIVQFINSFGHVDAVALGKNRLYSPDGFKALVNKKKTNTIKIDGNIAAILNERNTCCKDYQMYYHWAHMLDECFCKDQLFTEGKTIEKVRQMENYPCRIEDESVIKCEGSLNESKATYLQKYKNEVDVNKIVDAFWQIKNRLSAPQNDIDWWIKKPFAELRKFVSTYDTSNKRQRRDANYKQQAIDNGAKLLDTKDGYEMWYVPTYDAMVAIGRFYKGRSAKWCVASDDPDFWFDNHEESEFVVLVREHPKNDEFDKVAIEMMNHGRYYNEDDIIPWDLENEDWTFTNDDLMHEAWMLFKDNGETREQYFG